MNHPTPLGAAAQAVLDAFWSDKEYIADSGDIAKHVAAALRAAADQVVPQITIAPQQDLESRREAMEWGMNSQTQLTRHQLLAIAAELDTL